MTRIRKIRRKRDGKKEARIFDVSRPSKVKVVSRERARAVNHHRLSDDFTGKRDPPSVSFTEKYLSWSREEEKRTAEFPGVRLSRKKAR